MMTHASLARSTLAYLVTLLLAASTASAQAADFVPRSEHRYLGPATLTVHYLDAVGDHLESRTYAYEVVVMLGPPRRFGREIEDNPLHLEIAPRSSAHRSLDGQLGVNSASTLGDLRQHWTLRVTGERIAGELTGVEEGTLSLILDEANHLNSPRTMGYTGFAHETTGYDTIAAGSTLSGTLGGERVSLRLVGNVTTGDRPFEFEVTATRVDMRGRPLEPPDDGAVHGAALDDAPPAPLEPLAPPEHVAPAERDARTAPGAEPGFDAFARFAGTFVGGNLSLTLNRSEEGYGGELVFEGSHYPVRAASIGAVLRGTFESGGHAFAFEATLDGDMLTLTTAGTRYPLERQTPEPQNPLQPRNPLAR